MLKKIRGGVVKFFFLENQFFLISFRVFYAIFNIKQNIEKCPFHFAISGGYKGSYRDIDTSPRVEMGGHRCWLLNLLAGDLG